MIKVVCGIIYKGDEIFIARRKPNKSMGGLWEFPGGKLEHNESEIECLKRELSEELNMEVDNISYFITSNFVNEKAGISLIAYKAIFSNWNNTLLDHDQFKWAKTGELSAYNFSPPDVPIIESLLLESK